MRPLPLLLALGSLCWAAPNPAGLLRAGRAEARAGSWSRAEDLLSRSEEQAHLLDDPSLVLAARIARVDLRLVAEEFDSATAMLPVLPSRAVSCGDSAAWLLVRARTALAQGDLPKARILSDSSRLTARRSGEASLRSLSAVVSGRVHLVGGDRQGARARLKEARRDADGIPGLEASVHLLDARLELAENRPAKALQAVENALSLWRSTQDIGGILAALPVRAQVAVAQGDSAAARESWDALAHIAEQTGLPRSAVRARLMAGEASPSSAPARRLRAREILQSSGLRPEQFAPEWQESLR